jgi:hypothetical protein
MHHFGEAALEDSDLSVASGCSWQGCDKVDAHVAPSAVWNAQRLHEARWFLRARLDSLARLAFLDVCCDVLPECRPPKEAADLLKCAVTPEVT